MKFNSILFFLFCVLHPQVFSTTNVIFSNNSFENFIISSEEIDEKTNLVHGKDYNTVSNLHVDPLVSNVNSLNFNSSINIKNGHEYHFKMSILNKKYPTEPIVFYITTKGLLAGSKITETGVVFPTGDKINFDTKQPISMDISTIWNNLELKFVPYSTFQEGSFWPSFILAFNEKIDTTNYFDNSSSNTFSVMNYNVQLWPLYGDVAIPPNNKMIRAKNIPKLIGNKFDFISLNEVFDKNIRAQIKNDMEKNYPYFVDVAGMDFIDLLSSGVVVFSKWPILESEHYVFKNCYSTDCFATKGVTYVKLLKNVNGAEQIYNVFATHLQSENPLNPNDALARPRARQIQELASFIQAQNIPFSEPVLISGDLNVDTFETRQENYNGLYLQTEYEFLLDALHASDPMQTGLKYSYDSVLNTMLPLSETNRSKIDYVLYLNSHKMPIYATNAVITLRDVDTPAMYPIYDTSDHFPVIGEFLF